MKRILSLDGGGIRGVFSLEILARMEALLREHYNKPDMVLADHFDFFAGTSTGAIIATCLCWGKSVDEVLELYVGYGGKMFTPVPWYRPVKKYLFAKFQTRPITEFLQQMFMDEEIVKHPDGGEEVIRIPALLKSARLKKMLLVVVKNLSTGSAWPLTNNPDAIYNNAKRADDNRNVPLWQVVRASTAAPIYFDPEKITLGKNEQIFIDGGVTPYNNPALIAALTAILPCYNMNWPRGEEELRVISVGTMRFMARLPAKAQRLWLGYHARKLPTALIEGVSWQQDYLCRCLGKCLFGESLDSEIGDLIGCAVAPDPWFSYVRYNHTYKQKELEELLLRNPQLLALDAVKAIPLLQEVGAAYAEEHVKLEHLI